MQTNHRSFVARRAITAMGMLLFGAAVALGQQQLNLTAGPSNVTLPDGSAVPMWGYTCGALVSGSTAICAALNPNSSAGWSPVVITIPTGQNLQINLTNNLSFANGANNIPTSLVIAGQIGGGLGKPKSVPSPTHATQTQSTWPIVSSGVTFVPPTQGNRVQSFGTEVAVGAPQQLTWTSLKPGTYLLESGTHPSIQGPMGLYGILVVTQAPVPVSPTNTTAAAGTAYPNVSYDADVPLLLSEIDPVQNQAVSTAVNTNGFSETAVWSGQPSGCGNPSSSTYNTCYPPAVNYTPLYYLFNGVAFDKTHASNSLFPATAAIASPPATGTSTGQVLVRFVNAGLRMHVPSIVGSTTTVTSKAGANTATGFALIAEDGNPLPGVPRIQSEVFMAAGKTYDVMINGPAAGSPAIPVFDRELSLSGNATQRDAGMLAYLSINGAALPSSASMGSAVANPDKYSVVPTKALTISDVSKGLIANDINVYGVAVNKQPTSGTVILAANGTFTYTPCTMAATPCSSWTGDSFVYQANGSGPTALVSLSQAPIENGSGITVNNITYTASIATLLSIRNPGVLSVDSDGNGYPLSVALSSVKAQSGLTLNVDKSGGFMASVPSPGTYTFTYQAQNSQGTLSASSATVTINFPAGSGLKVNVLDGTDKTTQIADYRWIIEEDQTFYVNPNCTTTTATPPPGCPTNTPQTNVPMTFGVNFSVSHMPFVAQGCTGALSCESGQTLLGQPTVCDVGNGACRTTGSQLTAVDPSQVVLDPTKRYYISVLPGDAGTPFATGNTTANCAYGASAPGATNCGHTMSGAPIAFNLNGGSPVTVLVQPAPLPPGKLSVFVFEDDYPLNGEQDAGGGVDVLAPLEPGLGGFQIHLWDAMGQNGDFTGQMTYDMFNEPLTNSLAGSIDPATGADACPISKLTDGITGMIVTCPKYEADGKTLSPLAGQAIINNLMPGRWGVIATPGADRIARGEEWLQTNTLDGQKAHDVFTRIGEPSYFQEYGPASYHVTIGFANPGIINARKAGVCNGSDISITGTNCQNTITGKVTTERMSRTPDERLYSSGSHDSFYFSQCYVSFGDPDGEDFAFTKCNSDGTFSLSGLPNGQWRVTVFDQWNDALVDGLSTPVALTGGSNGTSASTVNMGDIAINQWQANLYTRTFIDDNKDGVSQSQEGGIPLIPVNIRLRDGSLENSLTTDFTGTANFNETFPLFNWYTVETDNTRYKTTGIHVVYDAGGPADGSGACGQSGYPACGTSTIGKYLANTAEKNSVPANLRVPGAVYCDNADCNTFSIQNGPGSSATSNLSTGRIDPPWVNVEGFQGFSGQNNFIEFGKTPYQPGENGGIQGHVVYASTRPFDDPIMLVQAQWEPLVPHVTINLYQEGTAPDGTQALTLVDTTQTSSFDDWAQGFRSDGVPNMNCPGQSTSDLFYFSLQNQPNYLNAYYNQHGGSPLVTLPDSSQYKCYDGMHNWNQVQPAPYDGMYKFPSIAGIDPTSGKPVGGTNTNVAGTNCSICVKNPVDGLPMLPTGKYVVEVVIPPGFELVKEEDKNILIGDNFIAPVTQQFQNLGTAVFIIPDQAQVASTYNANNAQNPTTNLGASPTNNTVPSYTVEPVWPCVGESRVVPDYISLFPGSKEVAPFAGATRNLCDRKEVTLGDQMGTTAKFYIYTSTHIASKFTGVITDDFTSEFDPFSPQYGEKFSPPNLPISIKDWTGAEISRVYSDQWGTYNGMQYSTWEVNPPNPTGYSPTMMVMCMNDPGNGTTPDPLFNPSYSQFCYELPFMPGTSEYLDTPVVPTSAFSEGYNHPDCSYPASTPAIKEVDGDGKGPWVKGSSNGGVGAVTITNSGGEYTSAPAVTFSAAPTGGTTATGNATIGPSGLVGTVRVTSPGSGYTDTTTVTFSAPASGTTATGTAVITNGVTGASIGNGGSGYCQGATVVFGAPAHGQRAQGAVSISGQGTTPCTGTVSGITITNPGSGYVTAPGVTIKGTKGSGATATSTISGTVSGITLTNTGTGYTSAPTVTISGAGTGAAAAASLSMGVTGVTIGNPGSGYITAPRVTFSGGGGKGAAGISSLSSAGVLTITALGDVQVINNGYSGPSSTTAPFNAKTVTRHYGFGASLGTVSIGGVSVPPADITTWTDAQIVVKVPGGIPACSVQQQTQYGGSPAQCGQLLITTATGQQSVDTVTVTVGGKAPTYVTGTIQSAIDAAAPGDLLMVPPGVYNEMLLMWKPVRLQGVGAASSILNANTQPAGKLDPWRRQVNCLFGLALNGQPSTGNADSKGNGGGTNPYDTTGVYSCPGNGWNYFTGGPYNPQVDRLPLEGILGWDTSVNGNLAQLLQEPTLMGAYEGAGITVLSKGVKIPPGATNIFGSGVGSAFPAGSTDLTANDCATGSNGSNAFSSNFQCNPSSIDGLSITDSSQGGGGIFVHAWGHNIQIANNRVYNNIGTLSGGISVGQGESPDAYLAGNAAGVNPPPSCQTGDPTGNPNQQLPYCFDLNVNVHNNAVTLNSSIGDELFSGTPAGAGGVGFCTGADYYKFNYNWVCGNMSTGDGGGMAHLGFIWNGDIEHNTILFNQSLNPTISTNGGGIIIMGAPPDGNVPGTTTECGGTPADIDCVPGLSDGSGPGVVINANLIMGNAAESGSGGGLRLQDINGTEVPLYPNGNGPNGTTPWNTVTVTNNIISNNVAGWDGGGISLQDALAVKIINNTVVSNDTTATAGVLFNTIGAPLASSPGVPISGQANGTSSLPQPAGLVAVQNSPQLMKALSGLPAGTTITCPAANPNCVAFSNPLLANDIFWQNRAFYIGVGSLSSQYQQNIVTLYNAFTTTQAASQPTSDTMMANGNGAVITGGTGACTQGASYWDIGVRGDTGPTNHSLATLSPSYSVLTDASDYPSSGSPNSGSNPNALSQYCNGSRTPPEAPGSPGGWQVPPGISDATVPNPIFSLSPAATVDEGNNWVNMTWGPLAMTNPLTGGTLGNYALASGSPAIGYIPAGSADGMLAPATDFYGNPRPSGSGSFIDVGAVQYRAVAPALLSIAASTGDRGTTVPVTLTGSNLYSTNAIAVSGQGVSVNGISVLNASTVSANFVIQPGAAPTRRNVTLTTPGGTSGPVAFTVENPAPPILSSVSPNKGLIDTTVQVTLTGTHLTSTTRVIASDPRLKVSGFNTISDTTVTASLIVGDKTSVGQYALSLKTPGGTSGTVAFSVAAPPPPTLTAINAASGVRGNTVTVTLTGTNFMPDSTIAVAGKGVTAAVSGVNAAGTSMTASFTIGPNAATGVRNVTVTTAGGTSTGNVGFTVNSPPTPTLSSLSPSSAAHGSSLTVTLTGTNLTSTKSIDVSGIRVNVTSVTVQSDTQVTATFNIEALAPQTARTVKVTTAGGISNGVTFTVN